MGNNNYSGIQNKMYKNPNALENYIQSRRRVKIMDILSRTVRKSWKVLDCGCANGFWIDFLFSKVERIYGAEFIWEEIDFIAPFYKRLVINASVEEIPFKNKLFDCVLFLDVIEHLREPIKAIQEIKKVLMKNGLLFLTTPSKYSVYENKEFVSIRRFLQGLKRRALGKRFLLGFEPHCSLFSLAELKKILQKEGFKIEEVSTVSFCLPFLGDIGPLYFKWKHAEVILDIFGRVVNKIPLIKQLNWTVCFFCRKF